MRTARLATALTIATALAATSPINAQTCRPTEIASLRSNTSGVQTVGSVAYVADADQLRIIDATNPAQPTIIAETKLRGPENDSTDLASDIVIHRHTAVITAFRNLHVVDITDPSTPHAVTIPALADFDTLAVIGDVAYPIIRRAALLFTVDLTGEVNPPSTFIRVPFGQAPSDIATTGDTLLTVAPIGMIAYDVSDPYTPSLMAVDDRFRDAFRLEVVNNIAYTVSFRQIQIADVSDPHNIELLATITPPVRTLGTIAYAEHGPDNPGQPNRSLYVNAIQNDSFDPVTLVIDVNDPRNPTITAEFPRTITDAAGTPNGVVLARGPLGLEFLETTDPANPTVASAIDRPTDPRSAVITTLTPPDGEPDAAPMPIAIVADSKRFYFVDLTLPDQPRVIDFQDGPEHTHINKIRMDERGTIFATLITLNEEPNRLMAFRRDGTQLTPIASAPLHIQLSQFSRSGLEVVVQPSPSPAPSERTLIAVSKPLEGVELFTLSGSELSPVPQPLGGFPLAKTTTDIKFLSATTLAISDPGDGLSLYDISVPAHPILRSTNLADSRPFAAQPLGTDKLLVSSTPMALLDVSNPNAPQLLDTIATGGTGGTDAAVTGNLIALNLETSALFLAQLSPDLSSIEQLRAVPTPTIDVNDELEVIEMNAGERSLLLTSGSIGFSVVDLSSCLQSIAPCDADANGDDIINLTDLMIVLANYGEREAFGSVPGDVTPPLRPDRRVTPEDLFFVLANFGNTCD